ncbi:hypothetical protein ES702_02473 [subsurface metagenome]
MATRLDVKSGWIESEGIEIQRANAHVDGGTDRRRGRGYLGPDVCMQVQ